MSFNKKRSFLKSYEQHTSSKVPFNKQNQHQTGKYFKSTNEQKNPKINSEEKKSDFLEQNIFFYKAKLE